VIPQLIIPIKTALNTRDPDVIATVLKVKPPPLPPIPTLLPGEATIESMG